MIRTVAQQDAHRVGQLVRLTGGMMRDHLLRCLCDLEDVDLSRQSAERAVRLAGDLGLVRRRRIRVGGCGIHCDVKWLEWVEPC